MHKVVEVSVGRAHAAMRTMRGQKGWEIIALAPFHAPCFPQEWCSRLAKGIRVNLATEIRYRIQLQDGLRYRKLEAWQRNVLAHTHNYPLTRILSVCALSLSVSRAWELVQVRKSVAELISHWREQLKVEICNETDKNEYSLQTWIRGSLWFRESRT